MRIVLGASRNTTFTQCPRKYKYRYIDKLPQKDWPFFALGSFVHRVLELWFQHLLDGMEAKIAASLAYAAARKEEAGVKIEPDDLVLAKPMLKSYMKDYLASDIETLSTEKKFSFMLEEEFLVRGIIDRVDRLADNKIEIIDYKTTKNPDRLNPKQLMIYAMAAKKEFGETQNVVASYVLLRHKNRKISYEFVDEALQEGEQELLEQGITIRDETEWEPKPSFLCNYCDYFMQCHEESDFWTTW